MNEDQKDYLNFGIGAILLGIANIFAAVVFERIYPLEGSSPFILVILWTVFVVDIMILISIVKWDARGE